MRNHSPAENPVRNHLFRLRNVAQIIVYRERELFSPTIRTLPLRKRSFACIAWEAPIIEEKRSAVGDSSGHGVVGAGKLLMAEEFALDQVSGSAAVDRDKRFSHDCSGVDSRAPTPTGSGFPE